MTTSPLPERLEHGSLYDSFYIEYVRRTRPFTMDVHHFHSYFELYCLLSGTRDYFVRDSTYAVEAGDLVFIGPNALHRTLLAGDPAHERIVVHIDDRYVRDALGEHAELLLGPFEAAAPIVRLRGEQRLRLDALTSRMLEELRTRPPGFELALKTAVAELLLLSARAVHAGHAPEASLSSPMHRKMSEIVRYLNASYGEPIKIGELAERFYISPYHMSRSFKAATGFTLIDYLNLTRVKEAQRLLRETQLPITEIAARTGFDNFSHFGKTFKKITRASARDYRKEHRAASPQ
ncbi:AraC-like protein [Cohnella sp. SGD-V74]|uniref:helix-turn-helix domain-containing protein n=1 Tax=unclassified Cohnella TaxID=2636738 RepID=UPI000D3F629F|nr:MULTISPECIES: AraC family transcriptional regulator [unclassified Cohnella]PRX62449.1 AraC-like protein [Cohnella sp. SGD-V74]